MEDAIHAALKEVQERNNIQILYACESGSRAWGFASSDSDYDVRFIYCSAVSEYLSIHDKRDVIELPVNDLLDIGGWDLKKVLRLFLKSNPPLYEWLQSPIVYDANSAFLQDLQQLMPQYFSGRASCHHYLSMANNTYMESLQDEQVRLKKYFYALRPLLAARWIIEKSEAPPMTFSMLRQQINDQNWQNTVNELMQIKLHANEKATIRQVPLLQDWILRNLDELKQKADQIPALKSEHQPLDELFRKYIGYAI